MSQQHSVERRTDKKLQWNYCLLFPMTESLQSPDNHPRASQLLGQTPELLFSEQQSLDVNRQTPGWHPYILKIVTNWPSIDTWHSRWNVRVTMLARPAPYSVLGGLLFPWCWAGSMTDECSWHGPFFLLVPSPPHLLTLTQEHKSIA